MSERESEERAIRSFEREFGRRPRVVASAPGRVNLIGEHVDYADGVVLPMPMRERTAVAMGPAASDRSRLVSLELDRRAATAAPAHFERGSERWVNAALGPLRALADSGVALPSVDAVIASEVPIGAGVSSSAALAVAMATAALRLVGRTPELEPLAQLLQSAEHRFVGTPCGIMDPMIALAGVQGAALRLDCRTLAVEPVPIPRGLAFVLVDSGVRHELATSGYATRRAEVEEAARRLGVSSLRHATTAQIEASSLPDPWRRRARHVVTEIERVERMVDALRREDLVMVGRLACESHHSLRADFEVSVPEVDAIVHAATTDRADHASRADCTADRGRGAAAGQVYGARMVGGGFGGGVLLFVPRDGSREALESHLRAIGVRGPMMSVESGRGYTASTVEVHPC